MIEKLYDEITSQFGKESKSISIRQWAMRETGGGFTKVNHLDEEIIAGERTITIGEFEAGEPPEMKLFHQRDINSKQRGLFGKERIFDSKICYGYHLNDKNILWLSYRM